MNLRREVSNALVKGGFRRNDRAHQLRVKENWCFWVDTGPLGKRSDIAPFVGIRHDGVEKILAELMGLPLDEWAGTAGANVGYVLGDGYRYWEPPSKSDEILSDIYQSLEKLRPLLSLDKLPEVWNIVGTKEPAWRYREMVILFLNNEKEAILERLEAAKSEFCKNEDEICEQYQYFAKNMLTRLNLHDHEMCHPRA